MWFKHESQHLKIDKKHVECKLRVEVLGSKSSLDTSNAHDGAQMVKECK